MAQQKEARRVQRAVACNTCGSHTGHIVWFDNNYRLVACEHCRLVSLDPLPEEQDASKLYDEAYYQNHYLAFAERRRKYFRKRVAALIRKGANGRLLDVGCGPGFFLVEAAAAGFAVNGIEPAPYAALYARQILGLPVEEGTLSYVTFPDDVFDTVTFWDVLGHIRDPHDTIEEASRIMTPDGLIALKVPIRSEGLFRFASFLQRGTDSRGLLHVPAIIHHYTLDSLTSLLSVHGLTVVGHEKINEARTGGRLSNVRWKHLAMKAFLALRHLIGLRDSLVVYAKRAD